MKAYKPLEKIKKIYKGGTLIPPKFLPTYYEWLSKGGIQIIKEKHGTFMGGGDVEIYKVPEDSVLFITSAWLNGLTFSVGIVGGRLSLRIKNDRLALIEFYRDDDFPTNQVLSFPIPLRVEKNQVLDVSNNISDVAYCVGFSGFLVKNQDIPAF
ncbi:unnamed protein product [marine sediment metagenome]|uniref:Uncharacterized protein n=1 Tax=marine sediment metagenome TaxID=412755 RepID=X1N1A0_9ZZZZ